jgi:hypothetical protein
MWVNRPDALIARAKSLGLGLYPWSVEDPHYQLALFSYFTI